MKTNNNSQSKMEEYGLEWDSEDQEIAYWVEDDEREDEDPWGCFE